MSCYKSIAMKIVNLFYYIHYPAGTFPTVFTPYLSCNPPKCDARVPIITFQTTKKALYSVVDSFAVIETIIL